MFRFINAVIDRLDAHAQHLEYETRIMRDRAVERAAKLKAERTQIGVQLQAQVDGTGTYDDEPCGECHECSVFCDVCGMWYDMDEPCGFH